MTFDHMMLTRLRVFTCSHYVIPQFVVAVLKRDPADPDTPRGDWSEGAVTAISLWWWYTEYAP